MFRKVVVFLVVLATVVTLGFSGCKKSGDEETDFKIGLILLHDDASTYDENFIMAADEAAKSLGLKQSQVIIKKNIPESNACYEAAVELVAEGCKVIFADSFGHEDYMIRAAKEFPNVEFCHATGTKAHLENLPNYHNAFASIYEGRYLAGIAAGLKLKELVEGGAEAHIGYIGAFTYAEVISGLTSFYLGVKEIVPEVVMDVQFTGSWYDEVEEKNAAKALISKGCVLISQHADSMGAPSACEESNVPNVSYNTSLIRECPKTHIISSRINWAPYIEYICTQTMKGEPIATDWTGTVETGSVEITALNEGAAAAGTQEIINEYKAKLASGEVKVFDTSKFTVNGEVLTSYMVEDDTEVVSDGYFHESEFRSAPYFDLNIDGITYINNKF